ncbi:MAG: hypothetical protein M4579_003048 [Chaenotheca gracillima]|nr:MAG: hypothetical protein M4579_003048 [Chaenotheca gracillima]
MKFLESCWTVWAHLLNTLTGSPWDDSLSPHLQVPLTPQHPVVQGHSPIFKPPNGDPSSNFKCNYTAMGSDWVDCSTATDRSCWLKGPGGAKYDLKTNYEKEFPTGRLRQYYLNITEMALSPDGVLNPDGKVFNEQYPGPWIQACWGDTIEITVENNLRHNGTAIHWHGIRQLQSMEMDGVPGVTQCPIAPGQKSTYKFRAMQYGTSWYHSHYSLQYGDGLLGPLTIYGPSSAPYDEAIDPLLISDWRHRSAFKDFYLELGQGKGLPEMNSILLSGKGVYNCTAEDILSGSTCGTPSSKYSLTFEKGTKYLLRLINTSVDNTYIFAIDNHWITVMSSDFVPIVPYRTDSVLVGIGQRYHVVIEAKPVNITSRPLPDEYWIRTVPADNCNSFPANAQPDERVGILRYNEKSSALPNTTRGKFPTACSDEPYDKLIPVLPWSIGKPSNEQEKSIFQAGLTTATKENNWTLPHGNFSRWDLGSSPLWLNFTDPTVLHTKQTIWKDDLVVVPQNYAADSWVYLIVTATGFPFGAPERRFVTAAHPIHLHGHDFAILQQSDKPYWDPLVNLKVNNPPRRDVALLPRNGYIVIAFKSDNPGSWLMHCHIAWHASSGLALQILERQGDIKLDPTSMDSVKETCSTWNSWYSNKTNWYNPEEFQDDSGI